MEEDQAAGDVSAVGVVDPSGHSNSPPPRAAVASDVAADSCLETVASPSIPPAARTGGAENAGGGSKNGGLGGTDADVDVAAAGDDGVRIEDAIVDEDGVAAAYDAMQEVGAPILKVSDGGGEAENGAHAIPEASGGASNADGDGEKADDDVIPAACDAVREEAAEMDGAGQARDGDDSLIPEVSRVGGNTTHDEREEEAAAGDAVREEDAEVDGTVQTREGDAQIPEVSDSDANAADDEIRQEVSGERDVQIPLASDNAVQEEGGSVCEVSNSGKDDVDEGGLKTEVASPSALRMVQEEDAPILGGSGDADDGLGANVEGTGITSDEPVVEERALVLNDSSVTGDGIDEACVKTGEDTTEMGFAHISEDSNMAGVANTDVPEEALLMDAEVGGSADANAVDDERVPVDEAKATRDDCVEEEAAQVDKDSDTASAPENAAHEGDALPMDQEIVTGIHDGTDEASNAGNDVEEEDARMGEDTAAGDDDEAVDGGTQMDEAAMAGDNDEDEEVGTAADDVPEEDSAPVDEEDDDDDEPPSLVTRKGGGRRKRGRPSSKAQTPTKSTVRRKDDEEVCFICFDGGELVVCDRRGCPKVYHPSCVNRDEAFFRAKGRWNCGWHICSICQKPARHMCYTCTYSLCKGCIKGAEFVCVRGNKGFCGTCLNTVMLIENKEEANEQMDGIDFDDKSSWWYLFKDYWLDLKKKLSLTPEEISMAKSRQRGSSMVLCDKNPDELHDANGHEEASSDSSSGRHLESSSSRKRGRKRSKQVTSEESSKGKESAQNSSKQSLSVRRDGQGSSQKKARKLCKGAPSAEHSAKRAESVGTSVSTADELNWASRELLDFVAHMRNGDKSILSQFDVQALLLEYIKRNNLRDPRRKSQIVCDPLLQNLFGKTRVGHFEMLKLLESHFLMNEVSPIDMDDNHGGVVDPDPGQDADGNSEASMIMSTDKRRKSRKKYGERGPQTNLDDYAAIDNHNINLLYLRRNLVEELIDNADTFNEKVVGSFVRIRISSSGQRQDIYRLVQVVGTGTAAEKYKTGKKATDLTLEIQNLDKREVITIDIISNQEFTEDECGRLKQSIKCGFIPTLTVGEVQEKARVLQALKVNDWIESEKLRLGHLRDRASDMGRRKELRECVEKLQLLNTPEERARRLNEEPEVHADPTMDPDYENPEEKAEATERRENYNRLRDSFFRKDSSVALPAKGDNWSSAHRNPKANWESKRNTWTEVTSHVDSLANLTEKAKLSYSEKSGYQMSKLETSNMEAVMDNSKHGLSTASSETSATAMVTGAAVAQLNVNESEKIWHYVDPSGKVQGPFSMSQLRKWNTTGYFPPSLRIWRTTEKQDDSILLTDALAGKLQKELALWEPQPNSSSQIDKTYTRSRSDVGLRSHNSSLLEQSTKIGANTSGTIRSSKDVSSWSMQSEAQHSPTPVAPYRSQSFSGRGSQAQDYDRGSSGSVVLQAGAQGYYGTPNSQLMHPSQQPAVGGWRVEPGYSSSNQLGSNLNPPITANFSGAQTIAVAGNLVPTTSIPVPMTANASEIKPPAASQNQTAPTLSEGRSADGSQLKFESDASLGRLSSSGEGLTVPVRAQPEAAQLSAQQLGEGLKQILGDPSLNHPLTQHVLNQSDTEKQEPGLSSADPTNTNNVAARADTRTAEQQVVSPNVSNSMAPSQLMSAPSVEPSQPAMSLAAGDDNQSTAWTVAPQMANTTGQAQGGGNMNWGAAALEGNANLSWGMLGQANMNMAWGTPAQGAPNYNMGVATPQQPNAVPNMGWVTPNQGNTNMNMAWATTQGQGNLNSAATMGAQAAQLQGLATAAWGAMPQGNATPYSGWIAPSSGNQNISWGTSVQGNAAPNPGNGTGQGNANPNWNSSNGNSSSWNNQQLDNGGRYSGQGDDFRGADSSGGSGRPRWNRGPFGSDRGSNQSSWGPRGGVCRFYENGHCRKGNHCNYYHPPRNERH